MIRGSGLDIKDGIKREYGDVLHVIYQVPKQFRPDIINDLEKFLLENSDSDIIDIQRRKESYLCFISDEEFNTAPKFHSWLGRLWNMTLNESYSIKWYQFSKKKIAQQLLKISRDIEKYIDAYKPFDEVNEKIIDYYKGVVINDN